MSIKEGLRPVTFLKNRAAEVLEQVNETRRPVAITQDGEPRGVLLDGESYEQTRRAIGLLKLIAQGEEDVRAGRIIPQGRIFAELRTRLKRRERQHG